MLKHVSGRKRILLVDDDRSITQMLSLLLETRGYSVEVACSGQDALNKISKATDLILLDLMLPDQEGFDVCRKLKENGETTHVPIIILSGKDLSEDIVEGLYLGADDYLTKPFEYEELVARMEAVMRRSAIFHNGNLVSASQETIIYELRKIIDQQLIVPFYQPIFELESCGLLGFEALSRPQTSSLLANPELLFRAAIQFGFYQELEIIAWKKALEYAGQHLIQEKLFLNCNPYLVEGPKFLTIKNLFAQNKVRSENVVLEITERSAISDFKTFYEHLSCYREHGFRFAVDDVGGGYASLEAIVEIKPSIVKIDRHIISGIAQDAFKRSIVKFIVGFCHENGIFSIGEGVETREDLEALKELDVNAAQGYYLSRPVPQIDFTELEQVSRNLTA